MLTLDDLETGDILLFSNNSFWFSRLVEWFTASPMSHTAIVIRDPTFTEPPLLGLYMLESGEEATVDAENGRKKFGVQVQDLKTVINSYDGNVWVRKLTCTRGPEFYETLYKCHSEVHNLPYDTSAKDFMKALKKDYTGDDQRLDTFWCSALVSYIYTELGFLPDDTPWTLIAPDQLSSTHQPALPWQDCKLSENIVLKTSNPTKEGWFSWF